MIEYVYVAEEKMHMEDEFIKLIDEKAQTLRRTAASRLMGKNLQESQSITLDLLASFTADLHQLMAQPQHPLQEWYQVTGARLYAQALEQQDILAFSQVLIKHLKQSEFYSELQEPIAGQGYQLFVGSMLLIVASMALIEGFVQSAELTKEFE